MKQVVMRWGLVLVLVSVAGASEADKKMGALVDGMRVGPLRRLDIGVTRKGTLIPAVVSADDLDLRTKKTRVLLVNVNGESDPKVSVGAALKWFYESGEAAEFRKRFVLSAVPVANPDGWVSGRGASNLSGGMPATAFP